MLCMSDICQINPQNISGCSVVNSRIKNVLNCIANLNSPSRSPGIWIFFKASVFSKYLSKNLAQKQTIILSLLKPEYTVGLTII
jgi:hypothetical protein